MARLNRPKRLPAPPPERFLVGETAKTKPCPPEPPGLRGTMAKTKVVEKEEAVAGCLESWLSFPRKWNGVL